MPGKAKTHGKADITHLKCPFYNDLKRNKSPTRRILLWRAVKAINLESDRFDSIEQVNMTRVADRFNPCLDDSKHWSTREKIYLWSYQKRINIMKNYSLDWQTNCFSDSCSSVLKPHIWNLESYKCRSFNRKLSWLAWYTIFK